MEYLPRSESFEDFLDRLNDALLPHFPSRPSSVPQHDSCQIVGLPRSGTTILYQLLARTGAVGYPSNVMAPYWRVPVVGARLQHRLAQSGPTISMTSVAGRTSEPLDPHEFGYFWRDALGHSGNTLRPDREGWPWPQLQDALDAIVEAFDAPTVHKNFLALHHAPDMRAQLRRSKFLVLTRDPRDIAASLWSVRQKVGVPDEATFGIDPGTEQHGDLVDRVLAQVRALEEARSQMLAQDCSDTMVVEYERLCSSPREVIATALEFLGSAPSDDALGKIPQTLPTGRGHASAPDDVMKKISASLAGGS